MPTEYILEYNHSSCNRDVFRECDRKIVADNSGDALKKAIDILRAARRRFIKGERFIDAELLGSAGERIRYWDRKELEKL
jgi:hypothetical protein